MRKQYRQASKKYYQDFIQGRVIDKNGNINFTNRGQSEKEIMAQVKTPIGVPHENDIKPFSQYPNGGVVYVIPYTRSDGVSVKGHYRAM